MIFSPFSQKKKNAYIQGYSRKGYSPTETLVEFDFGCKFNNNGRIRFYYQVITFAINTTTTTCNIPA
jgi:hypothetical protein